MRQDSDINRVQWNIIKIIKYPRLSWAIEVFCYDTNYYYYNKIIVISTIFNSYWGCPSPFSLNKIPNGTFLHIITFIQLVVRKFSFKGSPIYFVQSWKTFWFVFRFETYLLGERHHQFLVLVRLQFQTTSLPTCDESRAGTE